MPAWTMPASNAPRPSNAAIAMAQRAELHLGLSDETVGRLSDQIRARQAAGHAAEMRPAAEERA